MVEVIEPALTLARSGPLFAADASLRERLKMAFPPAQFAHVDVPPRPSKASWDRITRTVPMVGLGWLGLTPDEGNGTIYRGSSDYVVYVAIKNQVPDQITRGDRYAAGLLGVAGLSIGLLHGWQTPDVGHWTCGALHNSFAEEWAMEGAGLVALSVSCKLSVVDEEAAAALPAFLRLGVAWDLPPLPTVPPQLDVYDTITVRSA